MKTLKPLTDPVYNPNQPYTTLDRKFLQFIHDKRDLPFIYLTLRITFTLVPLAVLMFWPGVTNWLWWTAAAAYFVLNNFVFKGPFGLMLHCTSHRKFFKEKYAFLNNYLPWVIGPLFGQSPETYFSHHIGMHHPENNLADDESTTMPYQRDSFRSWLMYFTDFLFLGVMKTAGYFKRKNRPKLMVKLLRGETLFFIFCGVLCVLNLPAAFMVFILPFIISRIIMMLGNFAQHAFVDAHDPGNAYKNSITCINTKYNHKCWNDGYHISHHIKPTMHWTEHPVFFQKTLHEYVENEAIVFDGIHFLHVFAWLMTKRYDLLAKNFVNIGNQYSSDEEVIAFLKSRTQRIAMPELAAVRAA